MEFTYHRLIFPTLTDDLCQSKRTNDKIITSQEDD